MRQHKPGSIVVDVDVGGLTKGFHAVALQDGHYREKRSTLLPAEIAAWCRNLKATVIGMDAPCRWSLTYIGDVVTQASAEESSDFLDAVRQYLINCRTQGGPWRSFKFRPD